jgi:hypothetical protein
MPTTDTKNKSTTNGGLHRAGKSRFFGPPPLIPGEDPAAYDAMLARVCECVKPTDIIEDIWVRDIVDLTWEAFRLRRLKASLLKVAAYKGLQTILVPHIGPLPARTLSEQWNEREPSAIEEVNQRLADADLTMDEVMAQTLSRELDYFERIDRIIEGLEVRRNIVLREVERRRESFGRKLREAAQRIENGECRVIEDRLSSGEARRDQQS